MLGDHRIYFGYEQLATSSLKNRAIQTMEIGLQFVAPPMSYEGPCRGSISSGFVQDIIRPAHIPCLCKSSEEKDSVAAGR